MLIKDDIKYTYWNASEYIFMCCGEYIEGIDRYRYTLEVEVGHCNTVTEDKIHDKLLEHYDMITNTKEIE